MKQILVVVFFMFSQFVQAESWPKMPFPQKSGINIVSESMIFNGVPMKTWVLDSEDSLESVVGFYSNAWKTIEDSLYDQQESDGWVYINSKQGGFLLTAKLHQSLGRTQGFLGISNFEQRVKNFKPGHNFPLPRGSVVINDIYEKDIGKKQRYLLLSTQQSVAKSYEFYLKRFTKKGWSTAEAKLDPGELGAAIALSKDGDEINFVMTKDGQRTQITASHVEKSVF